MASGNRTIHSPIGPLFPSYLGRRAEYLPLAFLGGRGRAVRERAGRGRECGRAECSNVRLKVNECNGDFATS